MSIELDKRSINHLFGGWGSARNGKLTREWSLMTLLLLISKGRLVADSSPLSDWKSSLVNNRLLA